MPRPRKPRHCECPAPAGSAFKPIGVPMAQLEQIALATDELESLRLCDLLGLTQEKAGQRMGVSRGTVQRTVKAARSKVVQAMIESKAIVLEATPD